jgi:membrane dipeptidase
MNNIADPSRRRFFATVAGAGGAVLLRPSAVLSAEGSVDSRVTQILERVIGIDMHNHVYPSGTEPHPHFAPKGGPQGGPPQNPVDDPNNSQRFIASELVHTGLTAVCASFVLDFAQNDKPGDARANYLHWLDAIDGQLAQGHMRRALTLGDLQSAHEHHQPTIVQSVEGAHFIEGHMERVTEAYNRGLRHLQLLHEHDDMVSPLGDVNTVSAHLGGLTPFGAQVIRECNRLGIVVDMAHAAHQTVLDAVKVSTKPLIVSHTSLDTHTGTNPRIAQMMMPRLISREHAKVVADTGGIVGVWTHMADSLADFVLSIRQMADAIGVDHVGIGTDTDLLATRPGQSTSSAYPNLTGGFFPAVVGEMLRQGFAPDEVVKIGGGNYCRVFGHITTTRA